MPHWYIHHPFQFVKNVVLGNFLGEQCGQRQQQHSSLFGGTQSEWVRGGLSDGCGDVFDVEYVDSQFEKIAVVVPKNA